MPISSLRAVIDPLDGKIWKVDPINEVEVRNAVACGQVCDRSWQDLQKICLPPDLHRTFHIMRIAWLVNLAPRSDEDHNLILCVSANSIWFFDGNHRIAAAIVRGDPMIDLYIINSEELDIYAQFPGAIMI